MLPIPNKAFEIFIEKGLHVCEPFTDKQNLTGVRIGKPSTTPGNSIKDSDGYIDTFESDATTVILFERNGSWHVSAQEHAPLPSDGDFENIWNTVEEAVADILDFHFGDPSRMREKEFAYLESERLREEFLNERAEAGKYPIPEKIIDLLQHSGLHVGKLFGEKHVWGGGAWIAKPLETPGNCIEGFGGEFPNN